MNEVWIKNISSFTTGSRLNIKENIDFNYTIMTDIIYIDSNTILCTIDTLIKF